jgi:hypothetical protein
VANPQRLREPDYRSYFGRGKPLPFGQVYATLARLIGTGRKGLLTSRRSSSLPQVRLERHEPVSPQCIDLAGGRIGHYFCIRQGVRRDGEVKAGPPGLARLTCPAEDEDRRLSSIPGLRSIQAAGHCAELNEAAHRRMLGISAPSHANKEHSGFLACSQTANLEHCRRRG